ncbi:MAG: hypothetical protein PHH58_17685, partial [Rhodoferax sp.]|nr:hypothetical protein [Rhodoferax sp.]
IHVYVLQQLLSTFHGSNANPKHQTTRRIGVRAVPLRGRIWPQFSYRLDKKSAATMDCGSSPQ